MSKHKSEDYKISAVNYYLNNDVSMDYVCNIFINSSNKYLFTVPYTPKTNAIEMWFNQIKHTLKLNKKVLKFNELKLEEKKSIRKVKKNNYENYFDYAYNKSKSYKQKTKKVNKKIYK